MMLDHRPMLLISSHYDVDRSNGAGRTKELVQFYSPLALPPVGTPATFRDGGAITCCCQTIGAVFDAHACVAASVGNLVPQLANRGIDLSYVWDESLPDLLSGEPTWLGQSISRLVDKVAGSGIRGEVMLVVTRPAHSSDGSTLTIVALSSPVDVPAVSIAELDELRSLADDDLPDLFTSAIEHFLAGAMPRVAELYRGVQIGSTALISSNAHSLRGSASVFGAAHLMELCRRMEMASERGDKGLFLLAAEIQHEFRRVSAALLPWLASS
jgi:HPt (histidine-containing phosphotransfer) domain-containing protein